MREKSPRVIVFSLAYSPIESGAEIAVREITSRLPNFNFTVFTLKFDPAWPNEETSGNIKIIRLGRGFEGAGDHKHFFKKILYGFRAARQAHALWEREPIALVWGIMAAYGGLAALLFKLRHPRVRFLLTLQEGDSEAHILSRVGIFYPLWKQIFRRADYIQTISNYLAEFARRHGAKCQIEVVPNGVDLEKFSRRKVGTQTSLLKNIDSASGQIPNSPPKADSPPADKFQNQNTKTIITTSRLVYKNGIDILIRAVAQLPTRLPDGQVTNYQLLILGSGPEEQKLKQLAKDLKVEDKVEFVGQVDYEQIPKYLAQADIFARPSRSEGLGSSFLEAMAAGLPIIGTAVGGIPDFLKNGETGLFVKVDDPVDLAKKINLLFEDGKLVQKIARSGQKLVQESYSWDSIAKRIEKIFDSAVISYKSSVRILIATGLYPPEIGGPATYTALVEQELRRRGFKTSVLPFREVRHLPIGIRHLIFFLKCLFASLKNDFVYAQDPVSVGLPGMLAAKLTGRPFLIRVAGDYAWEQSIQRFGVKNSIDEFSRYARSPEGRQKYPWQVRLLIAVQKLVVNQAQLVITPSQYFQKLVSHWVKEPEKVKVIYNGIQLVTPNPKTQNPKQITKTILSAGRLVPWKGFDVLIELMKDLPEWKLIIAGDGPERGKLQSLIANHELQRRVQLVGAVPREKLLEYLSNASIFVLNTSFESFSFQVIEAMSAGVPVITTNIGNLPEIIENNKEGILVDPNRKEEILSAVRKIANDGDFRGKIIQNAKEKAKQFSIEKTMNNLVDLLSQWHK